MKKTKEQLLTKWRKIIQYGDIQDIAESLGVSRHLALKALRGKASIELQKKLNEVHKVYLILRN
jgi:hypothetical protein